MSRKTSRNDARRFPNRQDVLPRTAGTVIIGGGVVGAATSYYLARAGVDVLLLEKRHLSAEASGANAGFTWVQTKNPGVALELSLQSAAIYETLSEELEFDIEFERCGGMTVCQRPEHLQVADTIVQRQKAAGLSIELLDRDRMRELEPALAKDIVGGIYCPLDGKMNPIFVPIAYARAAIRCGARVLTGVEVLDIEVRHDRIHSVITNQGTVATEHVVNAAGPWAAPVGQMVNLNLPVEPAKATAMITEPAPRKIKHILLCGLVLARLFGLELHENESLEGGGILQSPIRQTRAGGILIGATLEFGKGYDKRAEASNLRRIAGHASRVVPFLAGLNVVRAWANFEPTTKDELPILQVLDNPRGFVLAAGHTANGMLWGPITGKLIAQAMTGEKTSIDLSTLSLERFTTEKQETDHHQMRKSSNFS